MIHDHTAIVTGGILFDTHRFVASTTSSKAEPYPRLPPKSEYFVWDPVLAKDGSLAFYFLTFFGHAQHGTCFGTVVLFDFTATRVQQGDFRIAG